MSKNKYEIDMVHGPLAGKILLFSIPLMCSSILQLLFNAADVVVVGQFSGPNSIAAVGSTGSVINLIVSLFMGLAVGVNVLAARYYAAGQDRDMSETVHTAAMISIIGGILITVIGILISRPILLAMGSPAEVIGLSTLYMKIYFLGAPSLLIYNLGSAILRAIGDTRRPLYYLVISGIINVILNLFFVIVLHLDVAGVAIATVISETVSAVLITRCLMQAAESYRFIPSRLRITRDKLIRILQLGVPAGLQGMIFALSNVLIQSSINSFGAIAMAGNAAASNLEGFVYMSMNSIYQACVSFTSQNFGAGEYKRIGKVLRTCLATVFIIGLVMGNCFYLFGQPLLHIYTSDPQAISFGLQRMSVICTTYLLCGVMDTLCGSLRGLGYSTVPMIVSLLGACGFRIIWIYTIFVRYHSLYVLYLSYPASWFLTALAHLVCYFIIRRILARKMQEVPLSVR